jgi:hypothetical protein
MTEPEYEWAPDDNWEVTDEARKCRMVRCPNTAVARMRRSFTGRRSGRGWRWWHYCADHLYGRKIENGAVLIRRVVRTTDTPETRA